MKIFYLLHDKFSDFDFAPFVLKWTPHICQIAFEKIMKIFLLPCLLLYFKESICQLMVKEMCSAAQASKNRIFCDLKACPGTVR